MPLSFLIGPGTLAALAAACAVALTVIAVCFIGCVCLLKNKQRVKKSNNHYGEYITDFKMYVYS